MSIDAAVAWAKKMADVLGEAVLPSNSEQATKAPRGGSAPSTNGAPSGNGAPATNGAPSAGGTPSANGAPAAAPSANGTPAPSANGAPAANGSPSANGAPAANDQPATGPASGPTGTGAKGCAETAQKAAADASALVTKAQAAEAEAKKFVTDAETAKKQVDEAKTQADTAEAAIGAAPTVPAPQGEDAKSQYDSSIQITGDMRKAKSDAETNESAVNEQFGVASEGLAQVESVEQNAKKTAEKAKQLVEHAGVFAQFASGSASAAASAAAASKVKADQAKDDAPDKATLQKLAQEDAQYAAAAKDAAGKCEAISKQVTTMATSVESQVQTTATAKQEAKAVVDAIKQKESGLQEKLAPYFVAVFDAELQEAAFKAKLSEEDAQAILQKRYEALGGDPELAKALADEDKDFVTRSELYRAELKRWQQQKIKELDESKDVLEVTLKEGEAVMPPAKQWIEREMPVGAQLAGEVNALGEKLKTEPGKELLYVFSGHMEKIEERQKKYSFNTKIIEKTQTALDALMPRYKDVDAQYEASEKLIGESRTELDNILQMDAMTLELKVDFLQTRPKPVRDQIQQQLDNELNRVLRLSILETNSDSAIYKFPQEQQQLEPIDWATLKDKIAKLNAATLEELQSDDPKLADAKAEYEKLGGDPALLDKRMADWKTQVEDLNNQNRDRAGDYQTRAAKLNLQLQEATARLRDSEANANGFQTILVQKRTYHGILKKEIGSNNATPQDRAEILLLEKEIKRIETQLKNYQNEVVADKAARANAEKVIEVERQLHEQIIDDDRPSQPKPTSEDIHGTPFPRKYAELTGKSVPA